MCCKPKRLPSGEEIACGKCWQCASRVIDDWTGRCLAEARTAKATHLVTLTYGEDLRIGGSDHVRAAVLTYSDAQRFVKSFRNVRTEDAPKGYPVRYFSVGEYGSKNQRAHWHILMFWQEKVPPIEELDVNLSADKHWQHGFQMWGEVTHWKRVRYCTKYIAKAIKQRKGGSDDEPETEEDVSSQFHLGLSKKPPLGDAYFRLLARSYVEQGLAPQDFRYSFPEVVYGDESRRAGHKRQFLMQGKTRRNFLRYFREDWATLCGGHYPNSEEMEKLEDWEASEDRDHIRAVLDGEKIGLYGLHDSVPERVYRGEVRKPKADDLRRWMDPARIVFREKLNVYVYAFEAGQGEWYFACDPETKIWRWTAKIGRAFSAPEAGYGDKESRQFEPDSWIVR